MGPGTGNRVQEWRTSMGMTGAVLAAALGINKSTVSRIESGKSEPDNQMKYRIALALMVRPSVLFRRYPCPGCSGAGEVDSEDYKG